MSNPGYLRKRRLKARLLGDDATWFDAGTHESLFLTSIFIRDTERIDGKISCPEKIALDKGYISVEKLKEIIRGEKSDYYTSIKKECGIC